MKQLLVAMERHEAAIGFFYSLCCRKFPGSASLWEMLSREEADHALWVRALGRRMPDRDLPAIDAGLTEKIAKEIRWIQAKLPQMERGVIDENEAVAIALRLEETIAERELSRLLPVSDPRLRQVSDALEARSREHRERIELFFRLRR